MRKASECGILAPVPLLRAAGDGHNPDCSVCSAGDKRPAGCSVW